MTFSALFVLFLSNHAFAQDRTANSAVLNRMGARAEWQRVGDEIQFLIQAPKINGRFGWLGFGFTPSGGMRGADIAICWFDSQGQGRVEDRFAPDFVEPVVDEKQDWRLLEARDEGNFVTFLISRKMETCDDRDMPITEETMKLIFAASPEVPVDQGGAVRLRKHMDGTTAVRSLYLFDATPRSPGNPQPGEQITTNNFRVSNVQIPAVDTMYWCHVTQFPNVQTARNLHMIGYMPLIQPGNEDLVHHILIYLCLSSVTPSSPRTRSFDCDKDEEQVQMRCPNLLTAWAIGSDPVFFPEDVSMALRKHIDNGGYVLMQMHYDNPRMQSGRVDNSGMEVYFTNRQRRNNAAAIRLGSAGVDWTVAIPPLQPSWNIRAECSGECLSRRVPPEGINIFMGVLHTHLLGTQVLARHIRGGKEIGYVLKDESYDFNYQQMSVLKKPVNIRPGDSIITDCIYSSTSPNRRTDITFGGESTREEMCMVFAFYYPAAEFSNCMSVAVGSELAKAYGYREVDPSTQLNNTEMKDFIGRFDWNEPNRKKIQQAQLNGPQLNLCLADDWADENGFIVLPNGFSKYQPLPSQSTCPGRDKSGRLTAFSTASSPGALSMLLFLNVVLCFITLQDRAEF